MYTKYILWFLINFLFNDDAVIFLIFQKRKENPLNGRKSKRVCLKRKANQLQNDDPQEYVTMIVSSMMTQFCITLVCPCFVSIDCLFFILGKVKSSKKEEDINWAETLQSFLPEFLR